MTSVTAFCCGTTDFENMADVDSLHDAKSESDHDLSAGDADVEDDEVGEQSTNTASLKKKNKKKRKQRDMEKQGGEHDDAESPGAAGDDAGQDQPHDHHNHAGGCCDGHDHNHAGPSTSGEGAQNAQMSFGKLQQIQKAMEMLQLNQGQMTPKSLEEAKRKSYQFWDTQPVPRLDEEVTSNEAIEQDRPVEEIRQDPYSLPKGFHWDTLDITSSLVLKELYTLLNENYVEDDDNMFRFDYSSEFLLWALQPPGWLKDWHCGVRVTKSNKLVGFISAVPANIKVYARVQQMVEINFLCVHKKLRSKRVAPVLIREITRRVNCTGIFQAVYTAGVVLPKPVATCRYWHRSLNPRKLIDVKFSHLSRNMTMQRTLKLYKLPESPKTPGFRYMTPADVPAAFKLLSEYLQKFELAPCYTEEEFRHWFIPRDGIIDSYVVEGKEGAITDFVSFYTLPSTVMHHPQHKILKAAYSFYNVAAKTSWMDLMQDALVVAKNAGFDVFNSLDLMANKEFLEKLKFGVGDGNLQYYLYNWKCPTMKPEEVGLVLQ